MISQIFLLNQVLISNLLQVIGVQSISPLLALKETIILKARGKISRSLSQLNKGQELLMKPRFHPSVYNLNCVQEVIKFEPTVFLLASLFFLLYCSSDGINSFPERLNVKYAGFVRSDKLKLVKHSRKATTHTA